MTQCAIYARYSSDLQSDRSIEDQISTCKQYAAKKGWGIVEGAIFTDRAISGASIIGRSGLISLLGDASKSPKPFDYVLIEDTSRLSRKMGEPQEIIDRLKFYDIFVYFISQDIDSKSENNQLNIGVHSLLDSQYRVDLKHKTLRGLKGQSQRGYNTGGRTYGYKYIKVEDSERQIDKKTGQVRILGTQIEIDPFTAEIIKTIYENYIQGQTIGEIVHGLNSKGVTPPGADMRRNSIKKNATWIPNTIRNILLNEKYKGVWIYNKRGWRVNPETGQRKAFIKDKGEWVINQRPDLEIIDSETWELAQLRIKSLAHKPCGKRGPRAKHLFSGLIKCHECGGNYVVVSSNKDPMFGCCTNKQRGKAVCSNSFKVYESELESVIIDNIKDELLTPPIITLLVNKVNNVIKQKLKDLNQKTAGVSNTIESLELKISNILGAIESGGYSDTLNNRLREIEGEISDLKTESKAVEKLQDYKNYRVDQKYIDNWIYNLRVKIKRDLPAARAELQALIGNFTVSPEIIDGVKYLRLNGSVRIDGMLAIASGGKICNIYNTEGEI